MYYALVHFPHIETTSIQIIRHKYDPTAHLVPAHITILFPVPDKISKKSLTNHIKSVLKHWKPFLIRINGLYKSWDNWLFLTIKDGNDEIFRLHKQIYTGIFRPYQRADINFVPHISLGLFVKEGLKYDFENPQELEFDAQKYEAAVNEANQLGLDYRCWFDKLHLVTLTNDFSKIEIISEFLLGG